MPYSVASGSGVGHQSTTHGHNGEHCSEDSIVRALDNFVASYERMNQTIMIPSRLRDLPVTVHFHKGTTQLPVKLASQPGQLVISNGKSETKTVDMFNIYEVLQRVRQELSLGLDEPQAPARDKLQKQKLAALTRKPPSDEQNEASGRSTPSTDSGVNELSAQLEAADLDDSETESPANKQMQLAALFRQHLQGLYTVLHQMTDAADLLTKTYNEALN